MKILTQKIFNLAFLTPKPQFCKSFNKKIEKMFRQKRLILYWLPWSWPILLGRSTCRGQTVPRVERACGVCAPSASPWGTGTRDRWTAAGPTGRGQINTSSPVWFQRLPQWFWGALYSRFIVSSQHRGELKKKRFTFFLLIMHTVE